jgi:hypothetical protein
LEKKGTKVITCESRDYCSVSQMALTNGLIELQKFKSYRPKLFFLKGGGGGGVKCNFPFLML